MFFTVCTISLALPAAPLTGIPPSHPRPQPCGGGNHQLHVVDDQEAYPLLALEPARKGRKLSNRDSTTFIDDQRQAGNLSGDLAEALQLLVVELAAERSDMSDRLTASDRSTLRSMPPLPRTLSCTPLSRAITADQVLTLVDEMPREWQMTF